MKTVTVNASNEYDVLIGAGLLGEIPLLLKKVSCAQKICIVSDSNVWPLYGPVLQCSLSSAGYETITFVFPAGEESKCGDTYLRLVNTLAHARGSDHTEIGKGFVTEMRIIGALVGTNQLTDDPLLTVAALFLHSDRNLNRRFHQIIPTISRVFFGLGLFRNSGGGSKISHIDSENDSVCLTGSTQNSFTVKRDPASGAIRCEAELSLMLSLSEKKPHSLPHALTLSSEPLPEPPKEPLILCYPEAGETVWDIAKHYRIPPALLCEANRLDIRTEFPDTKGLPLVIPKHPIFAKMKA